MTSRDFDILKIVVDRDEVERKDLSGPLETLKKLVATREAIREFQTRVDIAFSGYDHTREELFEIQDVRIYVYELNEKFPFWLYFLSRESMGLQCLSYCFLLPHLIEEARRETHPQQLADLIEKCWGPALDKICSAAGHTESESDALLDSALVYFKLGPAKPADVPRDEDDDAEEDDDDENDELFGLCIEDSGPFASLAEAIRLLFHRSNLPTGEIHQLAKLLLIIESLPRPTPRLQVDLDLVERHENGESTSMGIRAGSDEIRLTSTDYIILDPRIGGDSQTEVWFESSPGGWRQEAAVGALREWVEQFATVAADSRREILIFSDESSDDEIDWQPESSEALWEKLDTEYP